MSENKSVILTNINGVRIGTCSIVDLGELPTHLIVAEHVFEYQGKGVYRLVSALQHGFNIYWLRVSGEGAEGGGDG